MGRRAVLEHFRWVDGHADIWRVFADGVALQQVVADLAEPWRHSGVTHVVGIESRGFLLGAATAVALGVGFIAIRKGETSLLPGPKVHVMTAEDYRDQRHTLRMQRVLHAGDRVVLVDDWAERGAQALATAQLVQMCGAEFLGVALVVDQLAAHVRDALGRVTAVVHADELGPAV